MQARNLTEDEYKATFIPPVQDVIESATNVVDIWSYVDSVPATDLENHTVYDRFVEHVYRTADAQFDHVLVMTTTKNVYLVVIVDLAHGTIHGHRLLDLNREYGLS